MRSTLPDGIQHTVGNIVLILILLQVGLWAGRAVRFYRRHGIRVRSVTDEAEQVLLNHSWPGNVRELQNVIERAVILSGDNGRLEARHLGLTISQTPVQTVQRFSNSPPALEIPNQTNGFPTLAEVERRHILAALNQCHGNRTHAARLLDLSVRTLRNKLHEYNGTTPSPLVNLVAAEN